MYIPDITERFPEGFGGIDMTPSFFGEPVDYSRAYQEEFREDNMEMSCEEEAEASEVRKFELTKEYRQVGIYGDVTIYKVKEIDRDNKRILLSETWHDVDGSGTRPAKWHKLDQDEAGNERVLEWTSKEFGDVWIRA